jgi:hypothetical protein
VPTFYQRPLTWLFWIAAICLDAVALSIDYEGRLASALVLGQLFVVSGWLAVGRSPLVMRAACLVAVVALMTAPDYVIPRWRSDMHRDVVWPHVLALTMVGAAFTAIVTALWAALLRGVSPPLGEGSSPVIRFSVASCLGWMLLVAVGSTGLRVANFSLLADQPLGWLSGIGMAGIAAAATAASLSDYRASMITRPLNLIAILAFAGLIVLESVPFERAMRNAMPIMWGGWAFVAAWIFVSRLDMRMRDSAEATGEAFIAETPLRLIVDEHA